MTKTESLIYQVALQQDQYPTMLALQIQPTVSRHMCMHLLVSISKESGQSEEGCPASQSPLSNLALRRRNMDYISEKTSR